MSETAAPQSEGKTVLRMRGLAATIKCGYQKAAILGAYQLETLEPGAYRITAKVIETDAFWITQSPLTLELEVGPQRWSWRDVAVELVGESLTVNVSGRPERR